MRIAIVNDMRTAVEALRRVLVSVPNFQVAWVAGNGDEAVRKCVDDPPDLVLMDLYMPEVDGVEATRRIMARSPCPILIVTASVEGHAAKVFSALGAGALDAVRTPVLGAAGQTPGGAELRFKIETIGRMLSEGRGLTTSDSRARTRRADSAAVNKIVAIGASAGGPAALARILGSLSGTLEAAVVIVQHIDAQFAVSMAEWLGKLSALPVRAIRDGDELQEGVVLVAATNDHLILRDARTLAYSPEPLSKYYRPSVDVFFESLCRHGDGDIAAVLLTGMGRDGARGLRSLRTAGALTIAQDEASSVVYGMPKAAADLHAAAEILPLPEIAPRLTAFVSESFAQVRSRRGKPQQDRT